MTRINLLLSLSPNLIARDSFATRAAVWLSDCGSRSARTLTPLTPRLSIVERASRPVSSSRSPQMMLTRRPDTLRRRRLRATEYRSAFVLQ